MSLLYLAGPISGVPDYRERFSAGAKLLREQGHSVVNPAENAEQPDWQSYMRVSLSQLAICEGVAVLPGWERSRGARLELHVAAELGMPIKFL